MVEKYPKTPWYLRWWYTLASKLFHNSFEELKKEISELKSEEKLSSLLQESEVTLCV